MANILTRDTSEPEIVTEERAAEEADSLRVGEELLAAQDQLRAGKYRDAQELEKAYIELQSKLGEKQPESEPEAQEEQAPSTAELLRKYLDGDNDALEGLSVEDMAELFRQQQPEQQPKDVDLSDDQVNTIFDSVGGEQNYQSLMQWASQNLDKAQIAAYDSAVDSANMAAINLALRGLISAYQDANGVEGQTIQGKASPNKANSYRSHAELIAAMSDPRYETDPAYRMDVMSKLEMSPELQF